MTDSTTANPIEEEFDWAGSQGSDAMEQRAQQVSSGDFLPYFRLKDGESTTLRFLTDLKKNDANPTPWITVNMHSSVPTKPAPKAKDGSDGGNWPPAMSVACRLDPIFRRRYGGVCQFCQMTDSDGKALKPRPSTFALAQVREEAKDENGKAIKGDDGLPFFIDSVRKVTLKGEDEGDEREVEVPNIVVIQQGKKNFYDHLLIVAGRRQTVVDRDITISRKGAGQRDTNYKPSPEDPFEVELDGKMVPYNLGNPAVMAAAYPDGIPDLKKIVARLASDDYIDHFWGVGSTGSTGNGARPSGPAAASNDVTPSAGVSKLRELAVPNRARSDAAPAADQPAEAAPAPATQPEPAAEPAAAEATGADTDGEQAVEQRTVTDRLARTGRRLATARRPASAG